MSKCKITDAMAELNEWRDRAAVMLTKLKNRSDIDAWAWMKTGEKCYAAMVVQAFPVDEDDDKPVTGMLLPHPENERSWVDKHGRECLIMETVFENEHQSGAFECEVAVYLRNTVPYVLEVLDRVAERLCGLEQLLVDARSLIIERGESTDVPLQFRQHGWLNRVNAILPAEVSRREQNCKT